MPSNKYNSTWIEINIKLTLLFPEAFSLEHTFQVESRNNAMFKHQTTTATYEAPRVAEDLGKRRQMRDVQSPISGSGLPEEHITRWLRYHIKLSER